MPVRLEFVFRLFTRNELQSPSPRGGRSRGPRRTLILLLLSALGGWEWSQGLPTTGFLLDLLGWSTEERSFSTRLGEYREEIPSDDLSMVLNTAASVRVHTTRRQHVVDVDAGEALLNVKTDGSRRFQVRAGRFVVEANEAQLSLRREADVYSIRVHKGDVIVSLDSSNGWTRRTGGFVPVRLQAGYAVTLTPNRVVVSRFPLDTTERLIAWTHGWLRFENATLEETVAEINRYNVRQIAIADESIKKIRVGGTFKTTDIDGFIRAVETLVEADGHEARIVVLKGRGRAARDHSGVPAAGSSGKTSL